MIGWTMFFIVVVVFLTIATMFLVTMIPWLVRPQQWDYVTKLAVMLVFLVVFSLLSLL